MRDVPTPQYDPNFEVFLRAGLPEEHLDHADFSTENIPVIHLPEDWTPGHKLSIDIIRRVIARGIGICAPPDLADGFDLGWISVEIGSAKALLFAGTDMNIRNSHLLGRAASAVEISSPGSGHADLAELKNLRNVSVFSEGFTSALSAPALESAVVQSVSFSSKVRLSSSIQSLSVICEEVDISHILLSAPLLQGLYLYKCRKVDFRAVRLPQAIHELVIADCRLLKGCERLSELVLLKQLKLIRVSRIENVDALLDAHASQVEIVNCPDIETNFAHEANRSHPQWRVKVSRRTVSRSWFDIVPRDDGTFEVTFEDWEWVRSILPWDKAVEFGSGEMEHALQQVTDSGDRPIDFTFDSEDDVVAAIVKNRATAAHLRRLWDRALSDSATFAATCLRVAQPE